jgi:hypothetical protein
MDKEQELLQLIAVAVEAAKQLAAGAAEQWLREDATNAQLQFEKIAEDLRAGNLAPSHGGGLGITRALGEWAPESLYSVGEAVEDFYMSNF